MADPLRLGRASAGALEKKCVRWVLRVSEAAVLNSGGPQCAAKPSAPPAHIFKDWSLAFESLIHWNPRSKLCLGGRWAAAVPEYPPQQNEVQCDPIECESRSPWASQCFSSNKVSRHGGIARRRRVYRSANAIRRGQPEGRAGTRSRGGHGDVRVPRDVYVARPRASVRGARGRPRVDRRMRRDQCTDGRVPGVGGARAGRSVVGTGPRVRRSPCAGVADCTGFDCGRGGERVGRYGGLPLVCYLRHSTKSVGSSIDQQCGIHSARQPDLLCRCIRLESTLALGMGDIRLEFRCEGRREPDKLARHLFGGTCRA